MGQLELFEWLTNFFEWIAQAVQSDANFFKWIARSVRMDAKFFEPIGWAIQMVSLPIQTTNEQLTNSYPFKNG